MSDLHSLTEKLAQLSPGDRQWILEQLPTGLKTHLIRHLSASDSARSNDAAQDTARSADAVQPYGVVANASVDRLYEVLCNEPSWLLETILQLQDWPWRKELLHRLPALTRAELTRSAQNRVVLGQRATDFLMARLAERLVGPQNTPACGSSFDQLIERVAKRAPRR